MRAGLVGDDVGLDAAADQLRENLRGIAEQADRDRLLRPRGLRHDRERLVERCGLAIEIAGAQAHLDAARLAFDREHRGSGHGRGQRLRSTHAAKAGGEDPLAGKAATIMSAPDLDEGLVGALHDALAADIDPGARRHLAVHHQALTIELVEMVERRPVRHDVGVRDQHARRVGVGPEHADGLAGLHQQRLVGFELAQGRNDPVKAVPVAGGAADAAIDDELARALRDIRIEIVHQHAQGRFGQPAPGADVAAAGSTDGAVIVQSAVHAEHLFSRVAETDRLKARQPRRPAARRPRSTQPPWRDRRPCSGRYRVPAPARAAPR